MRPYIICHMVASIDGRIDCNMVEKISGNEYYTTLEQLNCPTLLEGRVTLEHYSAAKEPFIPVENIPIGKPSAHIAEKSDAYMVAIDTYGRLRWLSNTIDGVPLICIVSEKASKEYLETLKEQNISWVAIGADRINLKKATEILYTEFGIKRIGLLGGGHINGGLLEAGLIDEVSLLLAPGIDGREGATSLFDGVSNTNRIPTPLHLQHIEKLQNDVVWLRYKCL